MYLIFLFYLCKCKENCGKMPLNTIITKKMKDRIRQIMESMNMTQQEFANFVDISPASLSGIFKDRTRPTLNMVEAIKRKIPNLNIDWLMFGLGKMYDDSKSPTLAEGGDGGNDTVVQNDIFSEASSQQRNIAGAEMTLDFDNGDYSSPASASRQPRLNIENQNLPRTNSNSVRNTPNIRVSEIQKKVDITQRHITEIRIYFDDQTFETFVPAKK